jgi:gluconate 2-dehydrogenase gamma chain
MQQGEIARRQFLRLSASAVSGVWLAAAAGELAASAMLSCAPAKRAGTWHVFSNADAAVVDAIAALIIPSDGTPGAREAGVVQFIDRALDTFARDQRTLFAHGLADLRKRVGVAHPGVDSFAQLDSAQQSALLHVLENSKSDFFTVMLAATAAGMFATPEYGGNRDKIGWKLLGFEDRYVWQQPFGYYDRDEVTHA